MKTLRSLLVAMFFIAMIVSASADEINLITSTDSVTNAASTNLTYSSNITARNDSFTDQTVSLEPLSLIEEGVSPIILVLYRRYIYSSTN